MLGVEEMQMQMQEFAGLSSLTYPVSKTKVENHEMYTPTL